MRLVIYYPCNISFLCFNFQNMIRIIRTFMEDYRCQLGDFVNILRQTDKYMSANGNEDNFVSQENYIISNYLWK